MLDPKEIEIEIARLEYGESSYPAYAKLANLYTIKNQIEKQAEQKSADYAVPSQVVAKSRNDNSSETVGSYGDSDFLRLIAGKPAAAICVIIDELMDTLRIVNPRVYQRIITKISKIQEETTF